MVRFEENLLIFIVSPTNGAAGSSTSDIIFV